MLGLVLVQHYDSPASPDVRSRRGRILIVDDEPVIGTMLQRMLCNEHEVVAVTDARDALKLLDGVERFDVVISDLMMPKMSGMDLHAALQARNPALADALVFLTGGATTPDARAFLQRISNVVLEKPPDLKRLRMLVRGRVRAHDLTNT